MVFFCLEKLIILFLTAKLGLFPFFYWIVVVSIKIGLIGNLFVLRLQKIRVFWFLWLVVKSSLLFIYLLVYTRIFFVIINLLMIRDLWLLLVYSSIANTGIIILRVFGSYYIFVVFLYLFVIFIIVYIIMKLDNYMELLLVVFFFMVIPPFILFFMKFYIILRIDFVLKIAFFLVIFDVLVLLYYFSLVFIKFLLIEVGVLIYIMNLMLIFIILVIRNCVAMIIFYKS